MAVQLSQSSQASAPITTVPTTRRPYATSVTSVTSPTSVTLAALRRHIRHLQRESASTARTITQLKEIFVAQGRAFGYQSAQALTADEALRFWQNRYRALFAQMADVRALYVHVALSV